MLRAIVCIGVLLTSAASAAGNEFFEKEVRPVLASRCYSCHGDSRQMSGLRVDSRDALLKGGNRGAALVPGDPKLSLLARAVRHDGLKMPMGGAALEANQIAAIEKWISEGAPWPAETKIALAGPTFYERIKKEHWAFQPVHDRQPPDVPGISHPIDRFIVDALSKAGLQPSQPAGRAALIRRLNFALTGLPPTPLEVDLFVRDESPGAYERVVDRLLASPHFGEQWARHWMDVVRFAETFGNDWNYENKGAWLYRDYLIRAFNQDVPYDQLVREQIAGDLLAKPRINTHDGINESIIGTEFLRLGELGHDDCIRFRQIRTDVVDNQIDTLGKAFQGLTIACARCHDHKLDPIPTSDYYGLYGVLTSSRMVMRTADLPNKKDAVKERLSELKFQIRGDLARKWLEEARLMPAYLMAANRAWKGLPPKREDLTEVSLDRLQAWVAVLQTNSPEFENPIYPWTHAGDWEALKSQYRQEAQSRAVYNREHFKPLDGWYPDGNGLSGKPSASGEFGVASDGPHAVSSVFPAGYYSDALSERLNGALRSPPIPKDKKFVSVQAVGGKLSSWRTILDNCMLSEDYTILDAASPRWIKIPNRDDQPTLPFYVELVTKADNPRIPDRPGRLKATQEQLDSPYSYFGFTRAVEHDVDETPKDELSHMLRLFDGAAPAHAEVLAERYREVVTQALTRWAAGHATDDDARWIDWLLEKKLLTNSSDMTPLIAEYRFTESRISPPRTFNGMADLDPGYNFPILPYGDANNPGRIVPRGFLSLVAPDGIKTTGSGRREVAELIASPSNPLTARVMVNRLWQHLFGRGIVPTADNFGTYGEPPANPELLDYLAARFMREGWSVKKTIRFIVLSRTFQQASQATPEALKTDPLNRLLSHYPVHRLEGESIRDAVLTVSGRLDPAMYGPSIQPFREEPKEYRKLYQGPLDGNGRRSIYIKVTRHEGSRFLETFDFPNPNVARGNRDTTNVPSQALALLNDPFVIDQAGVWADRLIAQGAPSVEARLDTMFREALGRLPDDAERARFSGLVKELASLQKAAPDQLMKSRDVWKDTAHAIFNLKEFIYVR